MIGILKSGRGGGGGGGEGYKCPISSVQDILSVIVAG